MAFDAVGDGKARFFDLPGSSEARSAAGNLLDELTVGFEFKLIGGVILLRYEGAAVARFGSSTRRDVDVQDPGVAAAVG